MAQKTQRDTAFDIGFFEAVLRHDGQCVEVMEILGGLYTKLGRIADGLKMDRRLVRLQPSNATAHYNLACSLALSKRNSEALRSLREAVGLGYRDFEWMSHDPDLQGLKRRPGFGALVAQLKLLNLQT
jgi:tetratricopeptide (TPR) repeat protein